MDKMSLLVVVAVLAWAMDNSALAETDPAAELSTRWAAEQAARAERQSRLESLMVTMAEEMEAIRAATNPDERHELLETHRENMHEAMKLMHEMGGMHLRDVVSEHLGRASVSPEKADSPQHRHKQPPMSRPRAGMSDAERLADLETRVDMMQIMIESILGAQTR